jgi:hypothetical protein
MVDGDARPFLSEARDRIASSRTQHAEARSADGGPVDPWSADAVSWSLLGALVAVYARLQQSDGADNAVGALARACVHLAETVDSDSLVAWNDAAGRTQADVLAALDEAANRSTLGA